jgi:hypothetical protein
MTLNLPANRILKLTKGHWSQVKYPTEIVAQAKLQPADYFESVDVAESRCCVPAGGKHFKYRLDANTGRLTLHGETMFPSLSVTFLINDHSWDVIFVGRCMQVRQTIGAESDLNSFLTNFEYTLPSLFSVITELPIYCETVEIALDDAVEARSETTIPPNAIRVIPAESRVTELHDGIQLLPFALASGRYVLASGYLREALYYDSSCYGHNPYFQSLVVILKCAQAIEVLFGSERDVIRQKCKALGIADDVVEDEIVPIVIVRSSLGPAHASAFVPEPHESEVLRHFAHRAVHNIAQLLQLIGKRNPKDLPFLTTPITRDGRKGALLERLAEYVKKPIWTVDGNVEQRHLLVEDTRLATVSA